jgi:hypothetical protein
VAHRRLEVGVMLVSWWDMVHLETVVPCRFSQATMEVTYLWYLVKGAKVTAAMYC